MASKIFVVSDWRWTRCPDQCATFMAEGKCSHQRPFPIPHAVAVRTDGDTILSVTCQQGRKPGGTPCPLDRPDRRCKHVKMAIDHALGGGKSDDPIELSIIFGDAVSMPKCPNCRERWSVAALPDGRFSCRNPTCTREDMRGREQPFVFAKGEDKRPPPRRNEWRISERIR